MGRHHKRNDGASNAAKQHMHVPVRAVAFLSRRQPHTLAPAGASTRCWSVHGLKTKGVARGLMAAHTQCLSSQWLSGVDIVI